MYIHFFFANENPVGFQFMESEEHLNLQIPRHSIHSSFQDKFSEKSGWAVSDFSCASTSEDES